MSSEKTHCVMTRMNSNEGEILFLSAGYRSAAFKEKKKTRRANIGKQFPPPNRFVFFFTLA
jgi:hypothetical protein